MELGKLKPTATVVAQFAAGIEIDAIQHEGRVFLPVLSMGSFAATSGKTTSSETPAPARKSEPAPENPSDEGGDKTYTEDELMDMETKELNKICKSLGIDPDDTEGKNTNKKLRKLILAAQEKAAESDKGGDDGDDDGDGDGEDVVDSIKEILEDFDEGKKNKKKTIAAIAALYEDVTDKDKETITEFVEKFEEDADADPMKIAKKLNAALIEEEDDEDDKEEKKPSKKSDKGELVSVDDLEVGDRVSVYWNDDNKDWFDGTVKSIKKGKVVIAYDDDTEDAIDPDVHTKIKKLAK